MNNEKDFLVDDHQIEGRNAVLEAFRSGKTVDKLYLNCQDPRITLLKAVDTLNRQLELLAKAKGIATDHISVDIKTTLAVPELVKLIREALIEYPEALESVISKLSDFIQGEEQAV